MILFDDVVRTDYGQFDLIWSEDAVGFDGDVDRFFAGQSNGLVGAADPGGLYVHLAGRSGGSKVTIEMLDAAPNLPDPAWGDIVEVSATVPAGSAPHWSTWAGESSGSLGLAAGTYRVRVSAQGRDAGQQNEFAEAVVDSYLMQFWPGALQADAIVRLGSDDARYWHQEFGSRR
ncbi:hypothetical protein [Propionicicella superfundia]|uniref:hypothetical protein n=1 Tax=Propionicicella superfundia TaxID=348582 RepID=UPI00041783B2|nr:hypothetical protein [Propionicicella superfundia]